MLKKIFFIFLFSFLLLRAEENVIREIANRPEYQKNIPGKSFKRTLEKRLLECRRRVHRASSRISDLKYRWKRAEGYNKRKYKIKWEKEYKETQRRKKQLEKEAKQLEEKLKKEQEENKKEKEKEQKGKKQSTCDKRTKKERFYRDSPPKKINIAGSDTFWTLIIYILGTVLGICIILYLIFWFMKFQREVAEEVIPEKTSEDTQKEQKSVAPKRKDDIDLLCEKGEYLEACSVLFHKVIKLLVSQRKIPNKPFLTNREYLLLLQNASLKKEMKVFCDVIEKGFYACQNITEKEFQKCHQTWKQVKRILLKAQK